jgi:hypothetical protein
MSFVKVPSLDFTISSLGGVDLATIPFAFQYVNTSLYWVMEQVSLSLSANNASRPVLNCYVSHVCVNKSNTSVHGSTVHDVGHATPVVLDL